MRDGETRISCDAAAPQAIAVIGLGNLLLSDDGLGVQAIRLLRAEPRITALARLIDAGAVGPNLLAAVCGCSKLLIIDAVDAGLPPGTVLSMDFSTAEPQRIETRNAHQSGIPGLLDDLRLLGKAPEEIVLAGVQPAAMGVGTQLSPEVADALPELAAEVARQVERWAPAGSGDLPCDPRQAEFRGTPRSNSRIRTG